MMCCSCMGKYNSGIKFYKLKKYHKNKQPLLKLKKKIILTK